MLVFALTLWFNTASFLHACPLKGYTGFYFVQNRNMVAGHALEGFTYKEVTTADPMSCSIAVQASVAASRSTSVQPTTP